MEDAIPKRICTTLKHVGGMVAIVARIPVKQYMPTLNVEFHPMIARTPKM